MPAVSDSARQDPGPGSRHPRSGRKMTGQRGEEAAEYRADCDELQGELRDLLCLAVVGDHVRWVLADQDTAELAGWLREAATQWREWADRVARQLVALGVAPDGRVRSLAKDIPSNWVPPGWLRSGEAHRLLAERLGTVCRWAHYRRSQALSPGTVHLLDGVCSALDAKLANLPAAAPR